MAEIVAEMQERLLPEYEQLKKFEVCSDEQIRDCIRKRDNFQSKITQSEKSIRDYADYIIYEKKVHKWVTEKERIYGNKISNLKTSIAMRIIRLYRDGLRLFPNEERFWENYIQFSKKAVPHEVSGAYEKMLSFHGDKPGFWCDAALWAYEYSKSMSKVKDIFFRGLQRHPESEAINKTFFDILLMEASKMSADKYAQHGISEQEVGLERVEVIYRNSKKKISNINFFLSLLDRCEEEPFAEMTAGLQKIILDDLTLIYPREENLWDHLAQRELRGFNMNDLQDWAKSLKKVVGAESINEVSGSTECLPSVPVDEGTNEAASEEIIVQPVEDFKKPKAKGVWQKRTQKRRIELCCEIYQAGVRALGTPRMWFFYVNAMLKLNQNTLTQQLLKRKCLAVAFKECHVMGMMCIDHYCTFIRMLLESKNGLAIAEDVLSAAVKYHKSLKLYEVWLGAYIMNNVEPKVFEVFRRANADLGPRSFPLWRTTILYYKTRYDCVKRLHSIYREACHQLNPEFGFFRGEYLEFCVLNMTMERTRNAYDELTRVPPPCLEMHQKMATLESQIVINKDLERWRLCHENSVHYFGKTHSKVWIDFIKFERDHGDPKQMAILYNRAKDTLDAKLVDNFISEHTLLTAII